MLIPERMRRIMLRARKGCQRDVRYGLGQGGFDPFDPWPTRTGFCDCSGFAAWCLSLDRYQGDKVKVHSLAIPWIETSAIVRDACGAQRLFTRLQKPEPGCLVVYGDRIVLGRRRQGHVGIVIAAAGNSLRVIHCSVGNDRRGNAIQETSGDPFVRAKAIYVALRQDVKP